MCISLIGEVAGSLKPSDKVLCAGLRPFQGLTREYLTDYAFKGLWMSFSKPKTTVAIMQWKMMQAPQNSQGEHLYSTSRGAAIMRDF